MKRLLFPLFYTILLCSCNNATEETHSSADSSAAAIRDSMPDMVTDSPEIKPVADSIKPKTVEFSDLKKRKDSIAK